MLLSFLIPIQLFRPKPINLSSIPSLIFIVYFTQVINHPESDNQGPLTGMARFCRGEPMCSPFSFQIRYHQIIDRLEADIPKFRADI